MENGKRIEFNGAAKIVILAIAISAIMGITAIEAATYDLKDCPDCSESGLAFSAVESWEGENGLCCLYDSSIEDGYSGRICVYVERVNTSFTISFDKSRVNRSERLLMTYPVTHPL